MIGPLGAWLKPALHALPPEGAHRAAIRALKLAAPLGRPPARDPVLGVKVFGLDLPHPIGLAAGFDKSAEAPDGLFACGFGFVEVGTLTPRPQAGNPKPRLFRLSEDQAIINRMGFNNDGYAAARARLAARAQRGIVGVNFGPNKDSADRVADFVLGVKTFAPLASYLTINVSSPNTAGLRDLQRAEALDDLVARVAEARDAAGARKPLLIKIAPDLDLRQLDDVCQIALDRGVDGLIISNTTLARPEGLQSAHADEAGGLSGRPLFSPSTQMLARAYLRLEGAVKLIGCGGVEDAPTALAKFEAGADLVQVYTGFVYQGPALVETILSGLRRALKIAGAGGIAEIVGARASERAANG